MKIQKTKTNLMTITCEKNKLPLWGLENAKKGKVYGLQVISKKGNKLELNFIEIK